MNYNDSLTPKFNKILTFGGIIKYLQKSTCNATIKNSEGRINL